MTILDVDIHLPRPHPSQQHVIDEAARFNVLCCGRRWGKTVLGTDRLIQPAINKYPVAWFSPTYKMLIETWRELQRALQPVILKTSEQEHRLELLGGGVVECWSLETPDASRGRRYKRIVVDEAAMIRDLGETWQRVLRPTLTDFQGDAWFLSTPRGLNDFHEMYQLGQNPQRQEWASWRMPTSSNPYIAPDEIEQARKDLGPLAFAQEYEADFTALGDAAFPEFRPERDGKPYHVIPTDYDLIRGWKRVAGHDYGYGSPAATLWFAIDPQGGAVAYREWSARHLQVDEVAEGVLFRTGDERVTFFGDPSLFRANAKAYLTTAQVRALTQDSKDALLVGWQYKEAGLEMTPAQNQRIAGFMRLHTLFGDRGDGIPYLRFMDCCPDAIATFQHLQLDPDKDGQDTLTEFPQDAPVWLRDEYYDCSRYALLGIPTKALTPKKGDPWAVKSWNW